MQESATPSFLDRRAPDAPGGATAREAAPRQPDPTPIRAVGAPATNPTPATRALYAGDWAHFAAWCRQQRRTALPASADTLASYLLDVAPRLSRGSLGRRRAAVGAMHRQAGLPTPLLDGTVHASLRQTAKPKPLRSTPTAASLVRIAQTCPRDLPGRATAPCFCWPPRSAPKRPSPGRGAPSLEQGRRTPRRPIARVAPSPKLFLLGLDAEHVAFTATGVRLSLGTRADEAEPSRSVTLTRAAAACPGRALEDWPRPLRYGLRTGVPQGQPLGPGRAWTARSRRLAPHPGTARPQARRALMARVAARQATRAADALETFLRERPRADPVDQNTTALPADGPAATQDTPASAQAGRTGAPASRRAKTPLRLPHPDWLRHRLVVTGPAAALAVFRRAATGAGTIPWHLDLDSLAEDWFHRLVTPAGRTLSLAGARVLAEQLGKAVSHADTTLGSGQQHDAAIRSEPAAIERGDDFLAADGWKQERCNGIVRHRGCGSA